MMISCKKITKSFSEQIVLDSLSYDFKERGFYLLFGESGSGKTTFLNILSGFLPFDDGVILWKDNTFEGKVDNSQIEGDFDYITQDTYFVNFLTVMENMRLVSEDDDKITETLNRFGLGDKKEQSPATLSGGEKQRLAIARALLNKKKVLFLDEPTASLDEKNKVSIFEMLAELKQSVLIICSSHDEKAKEYADEIVFFSKSKRKAQIAQKKETSDSRKKQKKQKKQKASTQKKTNAMPYLKDWFRSNKRNKKANFLFSVFLVLSLCLCLMADTPENKLDETIDNLYNINMFTVSTSEKLKWEDVALKSDKIKSVVFDYSNAVPRIPVSEGGNESPVFYDNLGVIPFEKDAFKLSDNIAYGTYFTEKNQVMLTLSCAEELSSNHPETLIGKTLQKEIYGMGTVNLEIVGIFGEFNKFEAEYASAAGIRTGYEVMINTKLAEELESNENLYGFGNGRSYRIYFKSFKDMKNYYNQFAKHIEGNENVEADYDNFSLLRDKFQDVCGVIMAIAVLMALFATMFFVSLKRIEFMHNSKFISVFEYSGYSKRKVINQYILLNILEFLKLYVISAIIAFVITMIVNTINKYAALVNYQIFTYNIVILTAFMLLMIIAMTVFANVFFRKVKVKSWYENLISERDLI